MNEATQTVPRAPKEIKFTEKNLRNFWNKVDKSAGPDGCWLWTAGKFPKGYGQFNVGGRNHGAHCIAWMIVNGPIPHDGSYHGVCVCHNCPGGDNPSCVNPAHLFLGTSGDNNRDREAKGRGKQPRGDRNGARLHPERMARGEAQGSAKLTADKVLAIRSLHAAGGVSKSELGRRFDVSHNLIGFIIRRKIWKHIASNQTPPRV